MCSSQALGPSMLSRQRNSIWPASAEENVDVVVAEGGITSVVPLLTFFPAPEAEAKDRR